MKLRKAFLMTISTAILPLALVGVGQAQQMNCWGLTPILTEENECITCPIQHSPHMHKAVVENEQGTFDGVEEAKDMGNMGRI